MRRNRIILLILWLLALMAISNYGGQISYGFFILVTLIPFVSLFYIFCVSRLFRIYQHVNTYGLIANHDSPFEFILQNDSFIPFAGVRVFLYSQFSFIKGLDEKAEYEILPKGSVRKQTQLYCRYRGTYNVGIDKIVIEDFFRLFKVSHKIKNPLLVRIRPDVVHLSYLKNSEIAFNAVNESRAKRNIADVLSREYVPGDDPRLINWKVSASLNKLMVREQIGEELSGIAIVMDSCRYSEEIEEYLPLENKILEAVIALNLFFCEKGIPVFTYFEEDSIKQIVANRDVVFDEVYEKMSSFIFRENQTSDKLCSDILSSGALISKSAVFHVLHQLDENYYSLINEIEKHNIPQIIYVITDKPDESVLSKQVPDKTEIIFIDPDQDLKEIM